MTAQPPILWFLGLDPEDRRVVRDTAGDGYECRALAGPDAPELASVLDKGDADDPLLLWLGGAAWLALRRERPDVADLLQLVPTVLALDADADRSLLEQALVERFQQVIRCPLDRAQVFDALSRAREVRNMYQDMARMAREIMMERELLERKSEVCSFLFQSFGSLGEAANARDLIWCCRQAMQKAFRLEGLHALWWGNGGRSVYLLDVPEDSAVVDVWRNFLREKAGRSHTDGEDVLVCCGGAGNNPETERTLLLPLEIRGQRCGVLALDLAGPLLPGRDLALALDAVRRHLALVLWERGRDEEFFAAPVSAHPGPVVRHQRRVTG